MSSYQDLELWQEAMVLAEDAYHLTRGFPKSEAFGLTSQIRRAASSIPANVAEGWGREATGDYMRFLRIAQGSLKELETHLILSSRVGCCQEEDIAPAMGRCASVSRLLRGLLRALSR